MSRQRPRPGVSNHAEREGRTAATGRRPGSRKPVLRRRAALRAGGEAAGGAPGRAEGWSAIGITHYLHKSAGPTGGGKQHFATRELPGREKIGWLGQVSVRRGAARPERPCRARRRDEALERASGLRWDMAVPQPLNTEQNREAVPDRQTPPTGHGGDTAAPMFRNAPSPHQARAVLSLRHRGRGRAGAPKGGAFHSRPPADAETLEPATGQRAPERGAGPFEAQDQGHDDSLAVSVRRASDKMPPDDVIAEEILSENAALCAVRPAKSRQICGKCRQLRELPFIWQQLQLATASTMVWLRMIVSGLRKIRNIAETVVLRQGEGA